MNDWSRQQAAPADDELLRLWQQDPQSAAQGELAARDTLARVWRFDHQVLWRNFREYAAGLVLMVVFAGQIALGEDRAGGVLGLVCVGFVMAYLWWQHRALQPLDPAADLSAYRRALITRYDDQIHLLRTTPYWYLLPLSLPGTWVAISQWRQIGWLVLLPLAVMLGVFAVLAWLNVKVAVRRLRAARDRIAAAAAEHEP